MSDGGNQTTPPGDAPRSLFPVHHPESVMFDDDTWKIICKCGWECWNVEDEEEAWEAFNDHIFDDVNTELRRIRDNAKVVRL